MRQHKFKILAITASVLLIVVVAVLGWRWYRNTHHTAVAATPCSFFTLSDARPYVGSGVKLSQVMDYPASTDHGVTEESCVYSPVRVSPTDDSTLIVGVRTATSTSGTEMLKQGFETNVAAGEQPIVVAGYPGYVLAHDNSVELRIWANGHWVEVHAPTQNSAATVATTIATRIGSLAAHTPWT